MRRARRPALRAVFGAYIPFLFDGVVSLSLLVSDEFSTKQTDPKFFAKMSPDLVYCLVALIFYVVSVLLLIPLRYDHFVVIVVCILLIIICLPLKLHGDMQEVKGIS